MESRTGTGIAVRAACIVLVFAAGASSAGISKPADANVAFTATGPAGLEIHGATTDLGVVESAEDVVVTVPLGRLETGIALRDRHMKEKYLEVGRFPSTKLTVSRAALKIQNSNGVTASDVSAKLSLHGVEKSVKVHYEVVRSGASISVKGRFGINMKDFGIAVPSYLGVTVKPDVDVEASFRVSAGEGT